MAKIGALLFFKNNKNNWNLMKRDLKPDSNIYNYEESMHPVGPTGVFVFDELTAWIMSKVVCVRWLEVRVSIELC